MVKEEYERTVAMVHRVSGARDLCVRFPALSPAARAKARDHRPSRPRTSAVDSAVPRRQEIRERAPPGACALVAFDQLHRLGPRLDGLAEC